MPRKWKFLLAGMLGLPIMLGVGAWSLFRVEDIPATLEPVGDPDTLVIPGIGDQTPLAIAQLRGKTAVFVMVGVQDWGSEEGREANRVLNRWELPPDTVGYIIFDAEGFGFLAEQSEKYLGEFSSEVRFEMYGDFEGQFRKVFKLAQGHHGLVVVGPDGEVSLRKSGGIHTPAEVEELRVLVGAREHDPGPEVPDFQLGRLSDEACAARPCVLMFLGETVRRTDVPGIDDGFEGESEQRWAQMRKPAVRLASSALRLDPGDQALAGIVGETPGLEFEHWTQLAVAPDVREAFGVGAEDTVLMVLAGGRVPVRIEGIAPFYRFGEVSDLLGVEFSEDD